MIFIVTIHKKNECYLIIFIVVIHKECISYSLHDNIYSINY